MRRLFKRKWVIAVVAVIFALAIAGTAWAATGTGDQTSTSTSSTNTTTAGTAAPNLTPALKAFLNSAAGHKLAALLNQAQKNGKLNQQRLQAVLNLVKSKMTAADQSTFDQLVAQIKQDTQDLRTARGQLRTLIDKYLLPAGTGSSGTTTTTAPANSGA